MALIMTVKEKARQLIDRLPDDVGWQELMRELTDQREALITEQLDEVYADQPSELDPVLRTMMLASQPREDW